MPSCKYLWEILCGTYYVSQETQAVIGTRAHVAQEGQSLSELITIAFLLSLTFSSLNADLLIVLLKGGKILTSLTELTFFHTFTDIPVHKCTLAVHQVELVVDAGEHFCNGSGVADHAASTHDLCQVSSRNNSWGLVVNTALEASRRPVNKLDCSLCLDGGDTCIHILRDDVTSVHHTAGHVLPMTWVALHKHGCWLEDRHCNLGNRELLVVGLLSRDDWCVAGKHEVNTWIWHQVGLELGDIDVQGTIEAKRCSEGGDDLGEKTVQVGVGWALNVEVPAADIIEGLVVIHDGDISVLEQGMHTKHGVVWLHDRCGNLWAGPDCETELGLLAVVDRETLEHEASKTTASATTDSIVDHEALEASAVVSKFTDAVEDQVDDLLADGVMASCKVIGSILLTSDQLFRVEELTVGTCANLVNNSWLKVDHDTAWDMLAGTSLREESVERIITTTDGLI